MKKPFKETKFGKLLKEKLPEALNVVGSVLPDKGVLGIVKNIIDNSTLSTEEKEELLEGAREFELTELKMYLEDRQDARHREIEVAKTGRPDWMMYAVGTIILLLTCLTVYAIYFIKLENSDLAHFVAGEVLGLGSSLVFYYYGTSKSSSQKDETLRNMSK